MKSTRNRESIGKIRHFFLNIGNLYVKYLGHLQQKSTFFVGSGSSTSSTSSTSKDYHHLNLPPLGGGLVHGGGRHGDAAADPLGDAGGAIYSTGTETIDEHQGSAHQGWLVVTGT